VIAWQHRAKLETKWAEHGHTRLQAGASFLSLRARADEGMQCGTGRLLKPILLVLLNPPVLLR
jgi:hypothetical protein